MTPPRPAEPDLFESDEQKPTAYDAVIRARCWREDKQKVEAEALARKMDLAEFVRLRLFDEQPPDAPAREVVALPAEFRSDIAKTYGRLCYIGSDVNKLAELCRESNEAPQLAILEAMHHEIMDALAEFRRRFR